MTMSRKLYIGTPELADESRIEFGDIVYISMSDAARIIISGKKPADCLEVEVEFRPSDRTARHLEPIKAHATRKKANDKLPDKWHTR